jgi:hypothetical protein
LDQINAWRPKCRRTVESACLTICHLDGLIVVKRNSNVSFDAGMFGCPVVAHGGDSAPGGKADDAACEKHD